MNPSPDVSRTVGLRTDSRPDDDAVAESGRLPHNTCKARPKSADANHHGTPHDRAFPSAVISPHGTQITSNARVAARQYARNRIGSHCAMPEIRCNLHAGASTDRRIPSAPGAEEARISATETRHHYWRMAWLTPSPSSRSSACRRGRSAAGVSRRIRRPRARRGARPRTAAPSSRSSRSRTAS